MLVWVAVGVNGVSTIEMPIFAEVAAASGSVRTRIELISDPPFVKYVHAGASFRYNFADPVL